MGLIALILGVIFLVALIGMGLAYIAVLVVLGTFAISALLGFAAVYAFLGDEYIGLAFLIALPVGILGAKLVIKDFKGET